MTKLSGGLRHTLISSKENADERGLAGVFFLPSFAKATDSHLGMTSVGCALRSSVRSVVGLGYASEGSAPKRLMKPLASAGGAPQAFERRGT